MENLPDDFFTTSFQFTEHIYCDVYPVVDPTNVKLSQAGKVVVITGASGGISRAGIVPAFAKANAKAIVLVARNSTSLEATKEEISKINPSVQLLAVPTNISEEASVKALFEKIKQQFGTVGVLVSDLEDHELLNPQNAWGRMSSYIDQLLATYPYLGAAWPHPS